jgi:predicted RNA binding protein YcfA (HicA-like mRNA interferase family)
MNKHKLLEKILAGSRNVRFADFVSLVEAFGFRLLRVSGSHHIYGHPNVAEILNIQEAGGQAKPYQMRQFLQLVEKYDLKLEE